MENLFEMADEKLEREFSYKGETIWVLQNWDNFGADFGLRLVFDNGTWKITTYANSGYSDPQDLMPELSDEQVWRLLDHCAPTNENYKTN